MIFQNNRLNGKKYGGNIFVDEWKREINDSVEKTVVAQYGNCRSYHIGKVLHNKNLANTTINYIDDDEKAITLTLKNYYENQYKITIKQ